MPEPERGQHVQPRLLGSPVMHGDLHEDVFRGILRVFDEDVEVAVVVEDPGVDQLVLGLGLAARAVGGDQVVVGELALRVLVEHLQVRRRRRRVQVVVALLDVLAVVALGVGQAEEALLERRVALVPQGHRQAQPLLVIAQARQPVLAPPVGPVARLVVGERRPGVARVLAGVLPDRPPLALAEVGPPPTPPNSALRLLKPTLLLVGHAAAPLPVPLARRPAPEHRRRDGYSIAAGGERRASPRRGDERGYPGRRR